MATNFDIEKLRPRSTRLHRTHSAKVDTRLSKTDIADMEAKLAAIDAHMEHVRSDLGRLSDVPTRLTAIETEIKHLPGKGFVITTVTAGTVALVAILTILSQLGILSAG